MQKQQQFAYADGWTDASQSKPPCKLYLPSGIRHSFNGEYWQGWNDFEQDKPKEIDDNGQAI